VVLGDLEGPLGAAAGDDALEQGGVFARGGSGESVREAGVLVHGAEQGQGELALGEVAAGELARLGLNADVVDDVVGDLEGDAHGAAVGDQGVGGGLVAAGPGAGSGAPRDELGGLALDDVHVGGAGEVEAAAVEELEDLSFGHAGDDPGELENGAVAALFGGEAHGPGEADVAREDDAGVAEDRVGGGGAAALHGPVDHVVVEQRAEVEDLPGTHEAGDVASVGSGTGAQRGQEGAQPLASGGVEELADAGHRRHGVGEQLTEVDLCVRHLGADQGETAGKGRRAGAAVGRPGAAQALSAV
jgi:hypothetical protein